MTDILSPTTVAQLSALTGHQISKAFATAGMGAAAQRHGDVFNVVRRGDISEAVGTLKAGCSASTHKRARKALRKALREIGFV